MFVVRCYMVIMLKQRLTQNYQTDTLTVLVMLTWLTILKKLIHSKLKSIFCIQNNIVAVIPLTTLSSFKFIIILAVFPFIKFQEFLV